MRSFFKSNSYPKTSFIAISLFHIIVNIFCRDENIPPLNLSTHNFRSLHILKHFSSELPKISWTPLNVLSMGKAERIYKCQFAITRRFSERGVAPCCTGPPLYRTHKHKIYLKKYPAFISLLRRKALSVTNTKRLIQFRTINTVRRKT